MANFNPPDNHWADNFDERLRSTFFWLKDELEKAHQRIAALEAKEKARDRDLAQAVADAKHYARQAKGN